MLQVDESHWKPLGATGSLFFLFNLACRLTGSLERLPDRPLEAGEQRLGHLHELLKGQLAVEVKVYRRGWNMNIHTLVKFDELLMN